jgi:hypothetical protein
MVSAAEYPSKTQNLIAALVSVYGGIPIKTLMLRETFLFSLPCETLVPKMTSKTTLLIVGHFTICLTGLLISFPVFRCIETHVM